MYIFDVETLGIESTSVILSMACIYFNPEDKPTYQQLVDSAFFVKINAQDQVQRLKRSVSKSTLEWWETQHESVKKLSLIPDKIRDVSPEFAHAQLRVWATQFPDYATSTVWARGNLDQNGIRFSRRENEGRPSIPLCSLERCSNRSRLAIWF